MEPIVIICRKNVNRSPIAARMLEVQAGRLGLQGSICSRGYEVCKNVCVDESLNRKIIRHNYGTLANHQPREVSKEEMREAGIILTMSPRQTLHVQALFSDYAAKIHSLPEYAGGPRYAKREVRDPNRAIIDVVEPHHNANYRWQANVAHHLPVLLSRFFLKAFAHGRVDNRDREYISVFLERVVSDIERYTEMAIPRLVREGYLRPK